MKLETDAGRRRQARSGARQTRARHIGLLLGCGFGAALGCALALAAFDWSRVPRIERAARVVRAPLRFALARATLDPPLVLVIDQKFKHLHQLHGRREHALADGLLIANDVDFVPAVASAHGVATPVRLRLSSAHASAFEGTAWPLQLAASGDGHLLGMRQLSLTPLSADGDSLVPLLLQQARDYGLPAARQMFVRLTWNGEDRGLYSAIEDPSRDLVTAAGRTSSAIVAWNADEQRRNSPPASTTPYDDAFTAPLRIADGGRNGQVALALLSGYLAGDLSVSDTFDIADTARFLALAELWQVPEAVRWTDLHLAYDPISAKLSPIVHPGGPREPSARDDADTRLWNRIEQPLQGARAGVPLPLAIADEALARAWLGDPTLRLAFDRALARFGSEVGTTRRRAWNERIEGLAEQLHFAHPWSRAPRALALQRWAEWLARRAAPTGERLAAAAPLPAPRRLVIARDQRGGARGRIELAAGGTRAVRVTTLGTGEGANWTPILLEEPHAFPIALEPSAPGQPRPRQVLHYRLPTALRDVPILGLARVAGAALDARFEVRPGPRGLASPPLAGPSLAHTLERHPYLTSQTSTSGVPQLRIPAGRWNVDSVLAPPEGTNLVIDAGARLRFARGAGLLVRGGLQIDGTPLQPVVLEAAARMTPNGASPSWGGVAVLTASEPVQLRNVVVRGAIGLQRKHWQTEASVLVRAPRFDAENVRIEASNAELALVVDRCSAALTNLAIVDSHGDALQLRHSRVAADRVQVRGANRRAWWQIGGRASLRAGRFESVGDAAIEIDQAAQLEAVDAQIDGAGIGVVARDGSAARLRSGQIAHATHTALLAFGDAYGWGASDIDALDLVVESSGNRAIVQRGSRVRLDGTSVEPVDLDFAGLRRGP